jgi:hypothetical protein
MDINGSSSTYGETYTNSVYKPGVCPPPCIYTCYGEGYKCVNNICEYGVLTLIGVTGGDYYFDPTDGVFKPHWVCIFRYVWSDGSHGIDILIDSQNGTCNEQI